MLGVFYIVLTMTKTVVQENIVKQVFGVHRQTPNFAKHLKRIIDKCSYTEENKDELL